MAPIVLLLFAEGLTVIIVLFQPGAVGACFNIFNPGGVGQVPFDSFAQARFECFGGLPGEFGFYFGGFDGVAQVVAGTILNKGDLFFVIISRFAGLPVSPARVSQMALTMAIFCHSLLPPML